MFGPRRPLAAEEEQQFQAQMDHWRMRGLRPSIFLGVALYAAFALSDRFMLPDVYLQAWAIRFLLVVPLMLAGVWLLPRLARVPAREALMCAMTVGVALSIIWIATLSKHEFAGRYYSGLVLVVLFGNIMISLRFRSAVISSLLIVASYAAVLAQLDRFPLEVRFNSWLVLTGSAIISLIANYRMEQDRRRAFRAAMREQDRNEELSQAVEMLGRLSSEDALTRIPNRREFDRRLHLEWGRARREGQSLALVLIDVDSFKNYNDRYGHPAGDECLRRIAAALRVVPQRSSDLVARLGGEEFAVLLPATTIGDAAQLAEQMHKAVLDLHIQHEASEVAPVVSASFGVAAMLPSLHGDADELMANADTALYRAKRNGRNRVIAYSQVSALMGR